MLSIGAMASGQESYYAGLAREDYYTEGGEPPGYWLGGGAEAFGLTGAIEARMLRSAFQGRAPAGDGWLVQMQKPRDGRTRQPGWDLTFSAPKSVSVLWALGSKEIRATIERSHREAVEAAVSYLERSAAWSRRGHQGAKRLDRVKFLIAAFEHGSSRAGDCQLHTHALLINGGLREDGTWGAVRSRDLYLHKMVAGAYYRAQLAHDLRRSGLGLVEDQGWSFRLKAVPVELSDLFSTRRKEIEAELGRLGFRSPRAAELLCLSTRHVKEHINREELLHRWAEQAGKLGRKLGALSVKELAASSQAKEVLEREVKEVIAEAVEGRSYFTHRDVLRRVLERTAPRGIDPQGAWEVVSGMLSESPDIKRLGSVGGYEHFTTQELYALEAKLLQATQSLAGNSSQTLDKRVVDEVLSQREFSMLSKEQRAAIRHITQRPGAVQCLSGLPGAGKTTLLRAARIAWEKSGLHVIGCAVARTAAMELQAGSGVPSLSIRKTLLLLRPDRMQAVKHHVKQLGRAARKLPTWKRERLRIKRNTILLVDEASMVGTRDALALTQAVKAAGAKLVWVGGKEQLSSIDAGAPFGLLCKTFGCAKLREIRRQRDPWQRAAVRMLAEGDARGALSQYALHEKLSVHPEEQVARKALLSDWSRHRTQALKDTLVLTGTNRERHELNASIQALRRRQGELRRRAPLRAGMPVFFERDRVIFKRNNRLLDLSNGDTGTLEAIQVRGTRGIPTATILLDREVSKGRLFRGKGAAPRRVTVELSPDTPLELAYAVTTYSKQGATCEKTFALLGGHLQSRELTLVQVSRARGETRLYTTEAEAGEDLSELARLVEVSRQQKLAHELQQMDRGVSHGFGV